MSKGNKRSVYFSAPLMKLAESVGDQDSLSGELNRTVERYQYLMQDATYEVDETHLNVFAQVLTGKRPGMFEILNLEREIRDSKLMKEDPDQCIAAISYLKKCSVLQRFAIIEKLGL